jgi:hypothetical protein
MYLTLSASTNLLLSFFLLRKPLKDIASGEKKMVQRIITKKEKIVSEEAGSGTLYLGQKMKKVDVYAIIVDHTRYKIDKEVFDKCEEGGTIGFHYTIPGNWLIRIGE